MGLTVAMSLWTERHPVKGWASLLNTTSTTKPRNKVMQQNNHKFLLYFRLPFFLIIFLLLFSSFACYFKNWNLQCLLWAPNKILWCRYGPRWPSMSITANCKAKGIVFLFSETFGRALWPNQPANCETLPREWSGRGVQLNAHLQTALRFRMHAAATLHSHMPTERDADFSSLCVIKQGLISATPLTLQKTTYTIHHHYFTNSNF